MIINKWAGERVHDIFPLRLYGARFDSAQRDKTRMSPWAESKGFDLATEICRAPMNKQSKEKN